MAALEPYCECEVELALAWAVHEARGPVYIRLVSVPWELPFDPPLEDRLEPGRGTVLRRGEAGTFVATGPLLVSQAWLAAERLDFAVVALPWLKDVDGAWVAEAAAEGPIVCLDNHYVVGGQGDAVLAALAAAAPEAAARVVKVGIDRMPVCGSNHEVLRAHGLDAAALVERSRAGTRGRLTRI
jgi:transketolase